MKPQRPPQRGDLVQVDWVDIWEDPTGDPSHAKLVRRTSYGLYWGQVDSHGLPCVVTTTTHDDDGSGQSGFCCYPAPCVLLLRVLKRAKRRAQ